ncbi:MAG: DegT/DnrJ/EryC1/StrS family aminotransferase [Deltaproteobacteria bacterium]|jgi:dTDP-4-amino-4,6-dideoxygalactose transaminase|nr:DegT/DnrJ/EryC1/StrS family aminotransferase [Deltaproteobacteria bacterium]
MNENNFSPQSVDLKGLKPLKSFLSFSPPFVDRLELDELKEALFSGWLTSGPRAQRFEKEIASHLGIDDALALSSCTAALHLGLKVLGLSDGQAVVTTPLTFVSTAHAAVYNQSRPFLCDVSADTGNLDPESVAKFLEKDCRRDSDGRLRHKQTSLIISSLLPVHYAGHSVDLKALWELAVRYRLTMLEDAAHAIGSTLDGLPIGNYGHRPQAAQDLASLAAFSFYATKNITTSEGGLLTSTDPALLERARRLSAYGFSDARRIWGRYAPKGTWLYDVEELGYKCNFTDLQAALGLAQLSKLPHFQDLRTKRADIWTKALEPLSDLVELPVTRAGVGHSWHLYPLRLKTEALNIDRDTFFEALKALNIGTSVMFIPIHYHSYYQTALGYKYGDFPIAEDFFRRVVSLPIAPAHNEDDIETAAELTAKLLKLYAKKRGS